MENHEFLENWCIFVSSSQQTVAMKKKKSRVRGIFFTFKKNNSNETTRFFNANPSIFRHTGSK